VNGWPKKNRGNLLADWILAAEGYLSKMPFVMTLSKIILEASSGPLPQCAESAWHLREGKRIMEQAVRTFTSEKSEARKWIGRIIIAVILGEAIWSLIVSVMNNLVVPWLGDVLGQSSGLPASFTQRPYDYPDLFVSIVEFCVAGLIAMILNYFFQRQRVERVKPVKSVVATAPIEPAKVIPEAVTAVAKTTSPVAPPAVLMRPDPIVPPSPPPVGPAAPAAFFSPERPVAVAPQSPPVADLVAPQPRPVAPKTAPPNVKKAKETYYNSVGEPVPSDED
jgi:large-conductance mechanosensitive channel